VATGGSGGSCRRSGFNFAVFSLPTTKATHFSAIAALAVNSMQIREVRGHPVCTENPIGVYRMIESAKLAAEIGGWGYECPQYRDLLIAMEPDGAIR
jgi:hypothetical protein